MSWQHRQQIESKRYVCGYCGNIVASNMGFYTNNNPPLKIHICPNCSEPSYFGRGKQIPGVAPGADIQHLPADIESLYKEARVCVSVNAHTASVLLARKLLMNIAVSQDAEEGKSFIAYVEHLAEKGFVPPNGKLWVDHIRKKGNEANHEIKLMSAAEATELLDFLEMLLKFIYEFPAKIPTETT